MGLFSSLLPVAGAAAGGFFGGPAGAMAGQAAGSAIGGAINQRGANKRSRQNEEQTQQYLNQISGIGHQYYDPYVNQGLEAGNRANQEYSKLLDDPSGFINAILGSYKPSEGYQFKENHLRRGAANTSAAGGFAGTQYDSENQAALVNALLSDDMQQYLTNVTGAYGSGLAGKEGVAGRGFQASGNLADYLGSNLGNQAGLKFRSGEDRNAGRNNYDNEMMKLGSQFGGQVWGNTPGKIWDGRPQPGAGATPGGGMGPTVGGYGGPYRSTVPGAAWMR